MEQIFEHIEIFKIARENEIKDYCNPVDLKLLLEEKLKTPKYILGFMKHKEEIKNIKRAIAMLGDTTQVGYKVSSDSKTQIYLSSNDELNLYMQLSTFAEGEKWELTGETRLKAKNEIMKLAIEKDLLIAYYLLLYFNYIEYIELSEDEFEKVYTTIREQASRKYYLLNFPTLKKGWNA